VRGGEDLNLIFVSMFSPGPPIGILKNHVDPSSGNRTKVSIVGGDAESDLIGTKRISSHGIEISPMIIWPKTHVSQALKKSLEICHLDAGLADVKVSTECEIFRNERVESEVIARLCFYQHVVIVIVAEVRLETVGIVPPVQANPGDKIRRAPDGTDGILIFEGILQMDNGSSFELLHSDNGNLVFIRGTLSGDVNDEDKAEKGREDKVFHLVNCVGGTYI